MRENARCSTWGDTPGGTLGGTSTPDTYGGKQGLQYWLRNALAPQDEPLRWTGFPA
ncbi:MAG: hypothetical protein HC773_18665 [Scytonema sp. CRU_2_7]|nr:hypothetical protein [Scytonema sp. CRU_2_7]